VTTPRVVHLLSLVAVAVVAVTPAQAQPSGPPSWRPWRPIVAVGGTLSGAESLGVRTIEARAVAVGTATPPAFTLFRAESTLGHRVGGDLAIALPVTPTLAVEARGTVARPTLTTRLSGDSEGATGDASTERVTDVEIGGRVSWLVPAGPWPRRLRPFVAAGGAYVRQLHQDRILVETGSAWRADLGTHVWLRGGHRHGLALGLTAEMGWHRRTGGITFDDGVRSAPAAAVRMFAGF